MEDDDHMSGDDHENTEDVEQNPKKPKPRGTTTGIKAAKTKGPRHIEFDENNVPIGAWKKDFATELGVQARNINITYQTWKVVPGGKKNTIWEHMKKKYNIKDDTYKEIVIRIMSSRFKDFKSRLRGIFIYKTRKPTNEREELGNPLLIYKQISKKDWIEFEKQANDPKFKAKSDKARESQKENKCPHYMGRAGYAGKKDQWFEDELTKLKESNPDIDPLALEEMVNESLEDRSFTWMKGHTPASSEPPPLTQEVINNIEHWRGLKANGEFVPTRSEDVLVKVTGKHDRTGRMRGVGGFVTNGTYSGTPLVPEKKYTKKEFEMAKEEIHEKCRADMMRMMAEMTIRNGWNCPDNFDFSAKEKTPTQSPQDHSSVHSIQPEDPIDKLEGSAPCRLSVQEGNTLLVVAEGTVFQWKENMEVHHTLLSHNNARVCIDKCFHRDTLLPVPSHVFTTVGEVETIFVQWPKKWISLTRSEDETDDKLKKKNNSKETKESRNKGKSREDDTDVRSKEECKRLEGLIVVLESNSVSFMKIDIDSSVYQYEDTTPVHLSSEDLRQMFTNRWLNVSLLQVWGSNHWMMVVFCTRENIAYILDSHKEGNHSLAIKENIQRAWRFYIFKGGSHHPRSNELRIKSIECPQQPGDFECGYYVMKWMYDITVHYGKSNKNLEKCISQSTTTAKDVDKVREFWCRNFVDNMYD